MKAKAGPIGENTFSDRRVEGLLADFKERLFSTFGSRFQRAVLYGSRARGEATPDSDIDVLVVLDPLEDATSDWDHCIDIAADIAARTGQLISVLVCSSEDYAHREHPLLISIRREGVALR